MVATVGFLVLSSCASNDQVTAGGDNVGLGLPVSPVVVSEPPVIATPTTTSTTTTVAAALPTTSSLAPDPFRTFIATAKEDVLWLSPSIEPEGDPFPLPFAVPNPHQFGGPLTLMVVSGGPGDDWFEVQLPIRPNGQTAWVSAEQYDLSETRLRAEVDLSTTRVAIYDGDQLLTESTSVIGAESSPTPFGTFYVAAKRQNPPDEQFLGPWAVVLSGFSETLDTFSGGQPVIAIHGTDQPGLVGQALSNGCVRVPNDVITFIAENLPLGAPVVVSS